MQTKTYKSSLITLSGIDAAQDKIKCPPDSFNADFCAGYKDGYSDEAMDQIEQ
jgi:hypothetical protein